MTKYINKNNISKLNHYISSFFSSIDTSNFVVFICISLFILITSIHSNKYINLETNSLDPAWIFSLENSRFDSTTGVLGKDFFFTYGPLSQYLLPSANNVNRPLFHNVVSNLFLFLNLGLLLALVFYIYKEKKFINPLILYLIILTPLLFILHIGNYEIIVFINLFLISRLVEKSKPTILISIFLALYSSVFLLFKFNIGIYIIGFSSLLLAFSKVKLKKKIIIFLSYGITFVLSFLIFFFFTTNTINFIPFMKNSILIAIEYKEFMSITNLDPDQKITSLLFLLSSLLPIAYIKKESIIPYFSIIYFAYSSGWTRSDVHVLVTNYLLLFITTFSFIYSLEKIGTKKIHLTEKRKYQFVFASANLMLIIFFFNFLSFGSDQFRPKFQQNMFSDPIWTTGDTTQNFNKDVLKISSSFSPEFLEDIKDSENIMVIPWATHLPPILGTHQTFLPYIQQYQSYTKESDTLAVELLNKKYLEMDVLVHDDQIDNRIYMSETPQFTMSLLKNYRVQSSDKDFSLLTQKNASFDPISCKKVQDAEDSNFMQVELSSNPINKVKELILKPDMICIELIDQNGNHFQKRTYARQLERGLITHPFLNDLSDLNNYLSNNNSKKISSFKIVKCNSNNEVRIEEVTYFNCK